VKKILKKLERGFSRVKVGLGFSRLKHNRLIRRRMIKWLNNFDKQSELFKKLPLRELKSQAFFWRVGAHYVSGKEGVLAERTAVRELVESLDAAKGFEGEKKEEQERALLLNSFIPRTRNIVKKAHSASISKN
jgi:hypothetical protein